MHGIKNIKVAEHKMCVLIFFTNIGWNIFYAEESSAIYGYKCVSIFMQGTCYSCQVLMILEFSTYILKKKNSKWQVS
jgi:hypothetical protein